jgi:hypothetical protein
MIDFINFIKLFIYFWFELQFLKYILLNFILGIMN